MNLFTFLLTLLQFLAIVIAQEGLLFTKGVIEIIFYTQTS